MSAAPAPPWHELVERARARLERRRQLAARLLALGRITPELAERRLRLNAAVVEAMEEMG